MGDLVTVDQKLLRTGCSAYRAQRLYFMILTVTNKSKKLKAFPGALRIIVVVQKSILWACKGLRAQMRHVTHLKPEHYSPDKPEKFSSDLNTESLARPKNVPCPHNSDSHTAVKARG